MEKRHPTFQHSAIFDRAVQFQKSVLQDEYAIQISIEYCSLYVVPFEKDPATLENHDNVAAGSVLSWA